MASPSVFLARLAALLCFSPLVASYPQLQSAWRAREIVAPQIQDAYDYVVVGGGQAGLVLANRLSEDRSSTVLVVEHGYFDNDTQVLQPNSATRYLRKDLFNVTSVPQPGLGGSTQSVYAANVVGGGSTINGMMLNRGAADDYDNWEKLGNPGWGWAGLLPYFIKSTKFQAPAPQLAEEFNITWNASAYGTDGPIHLSYAPFQWPGVKIQFKGLTETGLVHQPDGSDGRAHGVFWYLTAVDNTTVTRSYARNQYWDPVQDRPNLSILTGWRVNDVVFDDKKHATGIKMQQRGTPDGQQTTLISARKEIVITAGSLHSPQVLHRSGIGPAALLFKANITVVSDLPGVGSNLQDHPVGGVSFKYNANVWPNPENANANATFAAWTLEAWANNRTGPLSQTTGNTAGLVPLKVLSEEKMKVIIEQYKAQDAGKFLPVGYTTEQIKGYEAQRRLLADSMGRDDNAVLELPIQASGSFSIVITKEVSRGTVLLNVTHPYAEPILDYNTFINPVDVAIAAENVRFVRRFHKTPSMLAFSPVEQTPGANITSDEGLLAAVRANTRSTTAHLSGTCAMMPKELGGVVSDKLLVHGVTGLSIADSSIMPLIPGAHLCSTVYAIAEKAADIIKARHA